MLTVAGCRWALASLRSCRRVSTKVPPTPIRNESNSRNVAAAASQPAINGDANQQSVVDEQQQNKQQYQLDLPRAPTDPVKQILIKRVPLEFHGPLDTKQFNDETLWFPIYRFAYIQIFRSIVRFKIYLTLASLSLCVHRVYLLFTQKLDVELFQAALLSSLTLGGLIFLGDYSRKIVCQIYRSEDSKYVRYCRLTFFGSRLDLIMPVETIIPLTEINESARKLMVVCRFEMPEKIDLAYDNYEFYDEKLYLPLRSGAVLDLDQFEKIMGKILTPKRGAI